MSFQVPKSPRSPESVRSTSEKKSLSSQNSQIFFDDYEGSEFEYAGLDNNNAASEKLEGNRKVGEKKDDFSYTSSRPQTSGLALPPKSSFAEAQSKEEGKVRALHFTSMNAYSKHIKLVNDYLMYYSGGRTMKEIFQRDSSKDKTDLDVIREEMKFIWDDDEPVDTWEKRLAKRYYDKLFKEYCICDLTLYKVNKIAMRWRIEKEVLVGKGQFICGEKKCNSRDGLKTWEVNFGYIEHGDKKNALVKLRLCNDCSLKLNFHSKKKEYIKPTKEKKPVSSSCESDDTNETTKKKKKKKKRSKSVEETGEENTQKKLKKDDDVGVVSEDGGNGAEKKDDKESTEVSGNSIILKGDDSLWKSNEKSAGFLTANNKDNMRENEFEDYLEDLFL